jgi:hypothetical protein
MRLEENGRQEEILEAGTYMKPRKHKRIWGTKIGSKKNMNHRQNRKDIESMEAIENTEARENMKRKENLETKENIGKREVKRIWS